jgi:hypothetical protein
VEAKPVHKDESEKRLPLTDSKCDFCLISEEFGESYNVGHMYIYILGLSTNESRAYCFWLCPASEEISNIFCHVGRTG